MRAENYYFLAVFCQVFTWLHWKHEFKPLVKRFLGIVGGYELMSRIVVKAFPELSVGMARCFHFENWLFVTIITCAAIYSIYKFFPKCKVSSVIQGTDVHVEIAVQELLKQQGDLAITYNTTFDTHSVNGFVKKGSLQWDFQHKFFPELEDLDAQIVASLMNEPVETIFKQRKKSNQKRYAVGTVAHIALGGSSGRHAFLLALSNSHPEGGSVASMASVQKGVASLWQRVSAFGPVKDLSVPVFGTGQAGVKDSAMIVIKEIVRSFVAASRNDRIVNNLKVCIHPKDFRRMRIDFYELERFSDVVCSQQVPVPVSAPSNSVALNV